MPIQVTCECGKTMRVADNYAGKAGKCPACGRVVRVPVSAPKPMPEIDLEPVMEAAPEPVAVAAEPQPAYEEELDVAPRAVPPPVVQPLQYVSPGYGGGGPIAPPPSDVMRIPTILIPKLRQPNCPPIHLIISTTGADVNCDFDASPTLNSFVEMFARKLKKKYDVRLDPPVPGGNAAIAFVRVISVQQGNRWLRYFLGLISILFGAGTRFEIDGNVQIAGKEPRPFKFKHCTYMGIFGGSSLKMLQLNAKVVAKKVAAQVRKAK